MFVQLDCRSHGNVARFIRLQKNITQHTDGDENSDDVIVSNLVCKQVFIDQCDLGIAGDFGGNIDASVDMSSRCLFPKLALFARKNISCGDELII